MKKLLICLGILGLMGCQNVERKASVVCNTPDGAVIQVEAKHYCLWQNGVLHVTTDTNRDFYYHISRCIVIEAEQK